MTLGLLVGLSVMAGTVDAASGGGLFFTARAFQLAATQPTEPQAQLAVQGRVVNGTAGAAQPEGLPVRLVSFTRDEVVATWESPTEAGGAFSFSGVARAEGTALVLAVEYQDATYVVEVNDAGAASIEQDLVVFEASVVDPGIRFEQSAFIFGAVDEAMKTVSVTELHSLTNPTDRTFTPRADGPGGPAGLLVFGLPPNAFELNPGIGLDPARVIQIGRGFASLRPITPGRTEMSFSYRVPYADSTLRIERTVRYPVESVRSLAPQDGPKLASAELTTASIAPVGERRYATLAGGPFGPGSVISLTLTELPVPGGALAALPIGAVSGSGIALGLALLLVYLTRSRPLVTGDTATSPEDELVEQLVALEIDHSAGVLDAEAYRASRSALLEAAATRARQERGEHFTDS